MKKPPGHCADSGGLRNMMCWRRFEATSCELSYPLYSRITTEEDIRLDMFTCCQGFWSLTIQTNFQWRQIFAEICELWHHHMLSSTEIFIPGFTFHAKPRTIARGPLMFVQSSKKNNRLHGGDPDMSFSVLEVVCQSLYLLQCNGVQSDSKCTFCDIVGHVMSWDRAALWKFAGHNDRKSEIHQEVRTQAGRDILVLEGWRIADDWALATHMISIDFSRNLKRHHLAISILKPYSYHIVII